MDATVAHLAIGRAEDALEALDVPRRPPRWPVDVARVAAAVAHARAGRRQALERALGDLLGEEVALVSASSSAGGAPKIAPDLTGLSPRLAAIAELVIEGRTDKEIAVILGVSHESARTYVTRLCRALGVSGRGGVLRWALGGRVNVRSVRGRGPR